MRTLLVSLVAAASLALAAAPTALADTPAGVTANGTAQASVDAGANNDAVRAAYRTALGAAVDDAKAQATFLAGKAGLRLGAITALVEQSSGPLDACASVYALEKGAPGSSNAKPSKPGRRKPKKHRRGKKSARHASSVSKPVSSTDPPSPTRCTIQANVLVTFSIAP